MECGAYFSAAFIQRGLEVLGAGICAVRAGREIWKAKIRNVEMNCRRYITCVGGS